MIKRGVLIVVCLSAFCITALYVVRTLGRGSDARVQAKAGHDVRGDGGDVVRSNADGDGPPRVGHYVRGGVGDFAPGNAGGAPEAVRAGLREVVRDVERDGGRNVMADDAGDALYGANCAGCHGAHGRGGAARSLDDPVFLRIADDATIRRVTAEGVRGTAMPAFAKQSGGSLTDEQIDAIIRSIRTGWTHTEAAAAEWNPPPYSTSTAGDATRGAGVYAMFCSRCHGADGRDASQASSIVDPSYLSLVSDQGLRTTVIAGRPDLGMPDWRGYVPGRPMSSEEVADVVAWLGEKRPRK